jgi:hypothetical protein
MKTIHWTTCGLALAMAGMLAGFFLSTIAVDKAEAQTSRRNVNNIRAVQPQVPNALRSPAFVVTEYPDLASLESGLNDHSQKGYHVVTVEAQYKQIGNPNDETFRMGNRSSWTVYPTWVVVYTK